MSGVSFYRSLFYSLKKLVFVFALVIVLRSIGGEERKMWRLGFTRGDGERRLGATSPLRRWRCQNVVDASYFDGVFAQGE